MVETTEMMFNELMKQHRVDIHTRDVSVYQAKVTGDCSSVRYSKTIPLESLQEHMSLYKSDFYDRETYNPSSAIDNITYAMQQKVGMDIDDMAYSMIFAEMQKRFAMKPTLVHECHNCGGRLELDYDKHVFNCPYCGAVYVIGAEMIHAR